MMIEKILKKKKKILKIESIFAEADTGSKMPLIFLKINAPHGLDAYLSSSDLKEASLIVDGRNILTTTLPEATFLCLAAYFIFGVAYDEKTRPTLLVMEFLMKWSVSKRPLKQSRLKTLLAELYL